MQIVQPIDIEDALRVDVGEYASDVLCCAQPAPDDLTTPCACFMDVGGVSATIVSHEYSVRVDVWADTYAEANSIADWIAGIVASLPLRDPESGRHYLTAEINSTPYLNPDPMRPTLPRASFRAELALRGVPVQL